MALTNKNTKKLLRKPRKPRKPRKSRKKSRKKSPNIKCNKGGLNIQEVNDDGEEIGEIHTYDEKTGKKVGNQLAVIPPPSHQALEEVKPEEHQEKSMNYSDIFKKIFSGNIGNIDSIKLHEIFTSINNNLYNRIKELKDENEKLKRNK